jgi:hypothetical protein
MFHSFSDAAVDYLRVCCIISQTLIHISPDNAVQLSHQSSTDASYAALLEPICCIDGEPAQLNRCPFAHKQVTRSCRANEVTLVSICPVANGQVSEAHAKILRRC